MGTFKNKNVLITGGASGIGKIMCRMALERGATVIAWDINPQGLEALMAEFSPIGTIEGFVVDLSDAEAICQTARKVKEKYERIDILINNAGIVVGKYFHKHSEDEIFKTMKINAIAPMLVAHQFIGDMVDRNRGQICTISSMAGLISNPKMSVYVASKWSALGWSDSVRLEMKQLNKNIKITTILPYYINTGMFDGVDSIIPILKPEKTAKKIIRAIEKERIFLGMPWSYNFIRLSQGIFPVRLFDLIVGKWLGVYKTMENFTGHKK